MTVGYRVRLRVRAAKGLHTDATRLVVKVGESDVTIVSQNKDEPLSEAYWIILGAGGFTTEAAALKFGERLQWILLVASLSSRLGVDAGENKATSDASEDFARAVGWIESNERLAPNVHGLSVLLDDGLTRFPRLEANARVLANVEHFTSALRELGEGEEIDPGRAANGVRLLNLALMTSEPLSQMVLAVSAVEELGQAEKWSEGQSRFIEKLAQVAEASADLDEDERAEVVNSIRNGLFRLSLRQGVMRLLTRLDLDHLRKEWDRLYGIRSGVFHGTARLDNHEIIHAAAATIKMCATIVLAEVGKESKLPSIAAVHFNPKATSE